MRFNSFLSRAALAACFSMQVLVVLAQTNKPSASSQVPAPSGTVVATPAQYAPGIKLNYVRTYEAMGAYTNLDSVAALADGYKRVREATQYMDGLGRPLQTVLKQATQGSTPRDIVTPVMYDGLGREVNKYLPYVSDSSNGKFNLDPFADQKAYLQTQYAGEEVFYRHTIFESSPLNRVQKTFAPGNSWAGSAGSSQEKAIQQKYLVNTAADSVRIWNITNDTLAYAGSDTATNIPVSTTMYGAGTLYKNVTIDEEGNAVVEYKDKDGRVILKKVQIGSIASDYSGHNGFLCTYYVYDHFNQLRFVMQPKAVAQLQTVNWQLQSAVVNELCFRYEYDYRNRMIAKKVPGAGWVYMVYDKRDRLVFSQDANMKAANQWLVTLYDALNRPVTTGMITYTGTRSALQSYVDANTGSGTSESITITGSAYIATQNDITVSTLQVNQQHYRAANCITWDTGFDSDNSTDLIAEIYAVLKFLLVQL